MLTLRLLGEKEVLLQQEKCPTIKNSEILIEIKASGLCGSDLTPYKSNKQDRMSQYPSGNLNISGHEPCGIVLETGKNIKGVKIGDRIIVHHYSGCRSCKHCATGWPQLCLNGENKTYGFNADGGNADYMVVLPEMCVPMPDGLSFGEGAAIACGTGTAYQALKRLRVSGTDTLAVFGQGPVGLSATLLGTFMGATVIAIDPDEKRLELAKKHGAEHVLNPITQDPVKAIFDLTNGEGADASIDATGISSVRQQMVKSTKIWGRACLVGEGGKVTFEPSPDIIHKHLTLMGSWTFSTFILSELSSWIINKNIPLKKIITHRYPLMEAEKAFNQFSAGGTGKVIFEW
jgi:threonine dehydrogenase-like Zn-dependent dehydrogenase